ncbi:5' nucleotidase, NT5C type (plasmid) [Clostridium perfringens]
MKIVIDLDNTIINSSRMVYELYAKDNKIDKLYSPDHDWNFNGLIEKDELGNLLKYFSDVRLYDNVIEMPNAIKVIQELSKNNEIVVATKHHKDGIPITDKWIRYTFKNIEVCYLNSFDKSKFSGDIFIDDRIDCLRSVKENFQQLICFGNFEWNKEWKGERINDWNSIYKYIKS